jgi:hypothetical protein
MTKLMRNGALLGAFVAATTIVWAAASSRKQHVGEHREGTSGLTDIKDRVALLEAQLRRTPVEAQVATAQVTRADLKQAGTATAPIPERQGDADDGLNGNLNADEAEYRQQVLVEAETKLVGDKMATEPNDPTWSKDASSQIVSRYRGEGFESMNLTVDCKSTLCKISFSNSDVGKATEAMRKMANDPPWSGPSFYHLDKKTGQGYGYVGRESFELPMVDPKSLTY